MKLEELKYTVKEVPNFTLSEAMSLWKGFYQNIEQFREDVTKGYKLMKPLDEFVTEMWDSIEKPSVQEALLRVNVEQRRVFFNAVGVEALFNSLDPELLDTQVIKKSRQRWNEEGTPWTHHFEDTYQVYRIEASKLFSGAVSSGRPFTSPPDNISSYVYAVRCKCTTTDREYWIYVPSEAVYPGISRFSRLENAGKPDAVSAIAWTIRIDVSNPKRIFRQGDIIVVEESEISETVRPHHLTKELYLDLMYSET